MPDGQMKPGNRLPILGVGLGRQRVGKTALLNAMVQYWRAQGSSIRVWNADQQNLSHALSNFFPDAEVAPPGGLQDAKVWIEKRIADQIMHRYDAVLDVGGGVTGFTQLVHEVRILKHLERSGIRMVGFFCVGPDKADLDYLQQIAKIDGFMPPASVIVLNSGMVVSGRSVGAAFEAVLDHPAIASAVERSAITVLMPALTCMTEVTDRGLSFTEAMDGEIGSGTEPLSFFDRIRVNQWWTEDIPEFFGQFPAEWMPTPTGAAVPDNGEAG